MERPQAVRLEPYLAPRFTTYLNTRTSVFTIDIKLPSALRRMKKGRTFRNPIFVALELQTEMKRDGITQADLGRRHGISRARVHQWLSLLELTRKEIKRLKAMGDYWERRLVSERSLRSKFPCK